MLMMQQPKSLDEMTLEELIVSLPLPPLDPDDPDPLMRMIARQELRLEPDTAPPLSTSSSD